MDRTTNRNARRQAALRLCLALACTLTFAWIAGCTAPEAAQPASVDTSEAVGKGLLITNVHLVPMDRQQVLRDHAVRVRDGVIDWVGPAEEVPAEAGFRTVDGAGGYLLPGLTDFHVHLGPPDELDLYLYNGVTTVVNLSGSPRHLELREAVRSGDLRGPTIYTAGPTIDGDPPRNPRFVPIGTPERAREEVRRQVEAGYDLLKIYDLISPENYRAAVAAAKEAGLPVAGHIPKALGLEDVVGEQQLIAHAEEFFYTFFAFEADASRLPEAARLVAATETAVCPNTGFIRAIIEQAEDIETVLARPELRFLPPSTLASWQPESNRYVGRSAEWLARNQRMYPFLNLLTAELHGAGVPLLSGSDAAVAGAAPGFSLHSELRELDEIGLSPFEALRTVTSNSGEWIAKWLDEPAPPGLVAPGSRGDLLLLGSNPLEDLSALRDLRGLAVRGEWIEHSELEADIEARAVGYREAWTGYESFRELVAEGRFEDAEALLPSSSDDPSAALLGESALNRLGYVYFYQREDVATAVAVFEMNVRAHPEAWNPHDSLGEAYAAAGRRAEAIASFRRSLELNPDNSNAAEQIEELEGKG